jgi:hypothetical protein
VSDLLAEEPLPSATIVRVHLARRDGKDIDELVGEGGHSCHDGQTTAQREII